MSEPRTDPLSGIPVIDRNAAAVVRIRGIEMRHEAWELLRVFHPEERITFEETAEPLSSDTVSYEVDLTEAAGGFTAEVRVSSASRTIHEECIRCSVEEASGPTAFLSANRKVRVGSALVKGAAALFGDVTDWGALTGVRPVKLVHMGREAGLSEDGIESLLVSCTGMSVDKARLLLATAQTQAPFLPQDDGLADIYIGIPFCVTRCLYCSFPSFAVGRHGHLIPSYLDALSREMALGAELMRTRGLRKDAVYIGGGTPTALDDQAFARFMADVVRHFPPDSGTEFTVEAGRPDTITREKLRILRSCGVNRISVNPQTMNAETLAAIGRSHSPNDIRRACEWVREAGFSVVNMDLIAGLPGEDEAMFTRTLEEIALLAPENLTIHTMSVKRASRLHEVRMLARQVNGSASRPSEGATSGSLSEPSSEAISGSPSGLVADPTGSSDGTVRRMVAAGARLAAELGMRPYYLYRQKNIAENLENVGYARPGTECAYNVHTMEENRSVLAFGSGAVSKRVRVWNPNHAPRISRAENVRELTHYLSRLEEMAERKTQLWTDE